MGYAFTNRHFAAGSQTRHGFFTTAFCGFVVECLQLIQGFQHVVFVLLKNTVFLIQLGIQNWHVFPPKNMSLSRKLAL